jgi:hypothetical protein
MPRKRLTATAYDDPLPSWHDDLDSPEWQAILSDPRWADVVRELDQLRIAREANAAKTNEAAA